jgi:cellulose synthase/poly-beta-1,6-N-acetylglucosamine synthase-like glycosyltransferase
VGVNLPDNRSNMVTYFGRLELAFLNCVDRVINRIMKITIIPGRNYVISKSALKRIGGFQNVLTEDVNISWRLYKSGRRIGVTRALCREQVPTRLRWYFKQQERWYAGSLREIKSVLKRLTLKEKFVYLPLVIIMLLLPHLLAGGVVLYLITMQNAFLFLIGAAYIMLLAAALRYLSLVDVILSPVVTLLYSFFQVFLFGASFFRKKNLKWYKTPKEKIRAE